MSREALEQVVERWINDPAFRAELRKDPEGAVRRAGLKLSPEDWEALQGMDQTLKNEALQPRIIK
jgi:hypothetical protein